jgi:hypothetical protein
MRIAEAVHLVEKMAANPQRYGMLPEEGIALLIVLRFMNRVVRARTAIRSVAEALDVDLNQELLFDEKSP